MKKIIHVNRQVLAQNLKDGKKRPTLTVKTYKDNFRGGFVEIEGPSILFDAAFIGRKQLPCGARVWIETYAPVKVDGVLV